MSTKKSLKNIALIASFGLSLSHSTHAFEPITAVTCAGLFAGGTVLGSCIVCCTQANQEQEERAWQVVGAKEDELESLISDKALVDEADEREQCAQIIEGLKNLEQEDFDAYDRQIRNLSMHEIRYLQSQCRSLKKPELTIPKDILWKKTSTLSQS